MYHRINRKKFDIYAFDIESHNDIESIIKNETSMWLGSIINENSKVDDEKSYIYSMDELLTFMEEHTSSKRHSSKESKPCKNLCLYIFNLSFEYSFILPYLIKNNFTYKDKIEDDDEYVFNSVSTKTCSSIWLVNIKFGKKNGIVILKDLAKIYGGKLSDVAKAFNLPTQKGEIDYRLNRLRNESEAIKFEKYVSSHKEVYKNKGYETWKKICEEINIPLNPEYKYIPTKEEKEYCFKDTRIIVDILLIMNEKNDNNFFNTSSMASYSMKMLLKTGYPRAIKPYQKYRESYPELGQEETEFLRKGVEGGITYATPKYQYLDIKKPLLHIDAHQMHPSQAYYHSFPYGVGEYFTGEPKQYFSYIHACRVKISYNDVKLHSVIKLIGLDFIEDKEIVLWDFEINTMKKVYINLTIKYIDGYRYRKKVLPWRRYYSDNYNKRLEAKKKHDAFNTLYYKLLNNSSYGKLLENPHNEIYENYINMYGYIDSRIIEKPSEDIKLNAKYTYLPVGSCIPAYSRCMLIETALKFGWEKIVYFDTDSIFVIDDKETERIWNNEINQTDFLGGWALEGRITRAMFTAPKRYKLIENGKNVFKAGGINFNKFIKEQANKKGINYDKYELEYDEVNVISSIWEVNRAFRCIGGTLIDFQLKEVKIPKKYEYIYKRNVLK